MLLLIGFGVVMGYSAGFNDPAADGGMTQTVKTLIWAAIGLTVFFVAASFDYHWLRTLAAPIYVVVLGAPDPDDARRHEPVRRADVGHRRRASTSSSAR